MAKYDFFLLYTENIAVGLFFLFVSLMSVWFLMRNHIYSIYEPMFFFLFLAASGYSVVYFLYYMGKISDYYMIMFAITQILFFIGWKINKPVRPNANQEKFIYDGNAGVLYTITSISFVVSQLIVYFYKGIPLFTDSRLEIFSGGGGFGIFNRIITVSSTISLSIVLFRMIYIQRTSLQKLYDALFVLFYLCTQVLSGSKAGLLTIVFIYGITLFYSQRFILPRHKERVIKKFIVWIIVFAIPVAFITIYVQSLAVYGVVDIWFMVVGLLMRFVNTGDIFFMAWPHDFIATVISSDHGFLALFKDFLGAVRLYPQELLPKHIGLAIFDGMYNSGAMSGPNARHNVFGLFYFGPIGSAMYSFMLGFLVGFIRNKLYYKTGRGIFGLALYVSLAYYATYIEQDFSGMAMMYFLSFVILYPIFCLASLILYRGSKITHG
jgi:hypothetical protein